MIGAGADVKTIKFRNVWVTCKHWQPLEHHYLDIRNLTKPNWQHKQSRQYQQTCTASWLILYCRYRVYLENEDDECHSEMETENVTAADYLDSDLLDIEDEKENQAPKSRRKSISNSDPINEKVLQVNERSLYSKEWTSLLIIWPSSNPSTFPELQHHQETRQLRQNGDEGVGPRPDQGEDEDGDGL